MQNFITANTASINMEEIIGTNFGSNAETFANKGKDFAKVLEEHTNSGNKNFIREKIEKFKNTDNPVQRTDKHNNLVNIHQQNKNTPKEKPVQNTDDTSQRQNVQANEQNQDITVDTVDTKAVSNEIKETSAGINTQVLSSDEVIQNSIEQLNNVIENSLDGQLDISDVKDIKATLEKIQSQIDNNEIVVSEDTKQLLKGIMDRLLTQNPEDLEISALEKELRQLGKDIQANAFKTQSQIKIEEEADNPTKALEMNIEEPEVQAENKQKKQNDENLTLKTKTEKSGDTTVNVSQNVKENQSINKLNNTEQTDIEQNMLDEMDVKIEEVFESSADTNSNNTSYTTAQDEIIKLKIENADTDSINPQAFSFDKSVQAAGAAAKPIQVEGISKELNTSDILNQVGSKFEQLKDVTNSKITMTLRPNDLGRVTIELMQTANGLTTNIIAQNSQVKELLDKNIDILKQQLAQQGVSVHNVQVKTVEQNAQTGMNNNFSEKQNAQQESGSRQQGQSGKNQQQPEQSRQSYEFGRSNISEGADFTNNESQNTAQINTMGGKIRYNI